MNISGERQACPRATPQVAIYNNLETFYPFLSRNADGSLLEPRKYRGDRALFWLGSNKLVLTSSQIPDAERLCQLSGYTGTHSMSPAKTSFQLSLDIMNDSEIVARIISHAGPGKAIQLIPYATTQELYVLADFLRGTCGLTVYLPESPAKADFWVRDFFDTKAGFRQAVAGWISDSVHLPRGFTVRDLRSASQILAWFMAQGSDCMVKPDRGESGLGLQFFDHRVAHDDLLAELQNNDLFDGDSIVVEEYITPMEGLSPSLELFVPPLGQGEPYITYLSNQHFGHMGSFSGVIISKSYLETNWYPPLAENGLRIAQQLQSMGYVGNFDLDTIIDQQGQVYLLEMNTRRTGGTHAHEFGRFAFSERYLDEVTLFSANRVEAPGVTSVEQLFDILAPVLFPMHSEKRGVVINVTSTMRFNEVGCLIAGDSISDVLAIKQEMELLFRSTLEQPAVWQRQSVVMSR